MFIWSYFSVDPIANPPIFKIKRRVVQDQVMTVTRCYGEGNREDISVVNGSYC